MRIRTVAIALGAAIALGVAIVPAASGAAAGAVLADTGLRLAP